MDISYSKQAGNAQYFSSKMNYGNKQVCFIYLITSVWVTFGNLEKHIL